MATGEGYPCPMPILLPVGASELEMLRETELEKIDGLRDLLQRIGLHGLKFTGQATRRVGWNSGQRVKLQSTGGNFSSLGRLSSHPSTD